MRVLCLITLALLAAPAAASAKPLELESRAADLHIPTLAALTKRGDVALIETTPAGRCKQVVIFALLDAPPEKVWDVIMDVESYPKFLKTVVSVEVTGKKKGITAFEWELDVPFFNLKGTRLQRGLRPSLVEVRGQSGNLRGSRERWELYPVEGGRTLAAFYRALDIETGGLLLGTMVKLEPSMDQGANLSTGFVHMRELAAYVAGRPALDPNPKPRTGAVPAFRSLELGKGELSFAPLEGLLKHGQLALIESHPDGALKQVALFTRVAAPPEKMKAIVQDPAKYPDFIPNFARQDVERTEDGKLRMDWELNVPLSSVEGVSLMTIEPDGTVDVVAQEGDIKRGRWRWEFRDGGKGATIPIHYVYSDVREASWVTKKLVEKQPLLEHGIVIASGTVAMTAMKARAEGVR
ncbi:MAG: SRPBCC family protein [Myxococcales bacterium]|nr:SRPBCC family protein [Myxococcales bacterium]MCB9649968.1 SRPBCC family protein [Deltaproteobacteria bacterium]